MQLTHTSHFTLHTHSQDWSVRSEEKQSTAAIVYSATRWYIPGTPSATPSLLGRLVRLPQAVRCELPPKAPSTSASGHWSLATCHLPLASDQWCDL